MSQLPVHRVPDSSPHPDTSTPARGPFHLFESEHRVFLVGMRWATPLEGTGRSAEGQAVDAANRAGAPLFSLRTQPQQYGLPVAGFILPGSRTQVFSAAAMLADAMPGPWIGAWPLADNRCIVLAVGLQGVLPDGDQVMESIGAARDWLMGKTLTSSGAWRRVYVPAEWGLPLAQSSQATLEELLARARKAPQQTSPLRRPIGAGARRRRWIAAVAAAVGSIGAVGVWLAQPEQRGVIERVTSTQSAGPPAPPPLSWITAGDAFEACLDAQVEAADLMRIGGWPPESIRCDGSSLTVTLRGEAPAWLILTAQPSAQLDARSKQATVVRRIRSAAPRAWPADVGLSPAQSYDVYLRLAADRVGGTASVTNIAKALPGEDRTRQRSNTGTAEWTLTTTAPRQVLRSTLSPLEAAELRVAAWNVSTATWTLQGVLHVAR